MRDFKRWAQFALGQPFSPVLLNILVTSVCNMRCTHCFFTDELDDGPRKKLQMKTRDIERISETLGSNLGVLILAGGEPSLAPTYLKSRERFRPTTSWDRSTSHPTARFGNESFRMSPESCRNVPS